MIELREGDRVVELNPGEKIIQSFRATDFRNIGERSGAYSNQFTVPVTNNNRETFGFAGQLNLNSNPANNRFESELFYNGLNISKGYLRVDSASDEYELTYFSGIADWLSLIGDRSLRDLRLANLDHVLNEATIVASYDHTWEDGYIYTILNYAGNLTAKSDSATTTSETWRPAIFVAYLVKEIFREIGWKVSGIFDDPVFTRMVIPSFAMNPVNLAGLGASTRFYPSVSGVTNQNLIGNTNYPDFGLTNAQGLYNETTGVFTADNTYLVRSFAGVRIFNNEAMPVTFSLNLYKNAGLVATDSQVVGSASSLPFAIDENVSADSGDTLYFTIESTVPGASFTIPQIYLAAGAESWVFFEPTIQATDGTFWGGYYGLPDIKQRDLLKYVIVSLGVITQTNSKDKELVLKLFESLSTDDSTTWEGRLDNSVQHKHNYTALVEKYGRSNYLKYRVGKEDRDEEYEDQNGIPFGSGQFALANENLPDEVDIYEAPFIGAFNVAAFTGTSLSTKPLIPYIPDENSGYILVLHGQTTFGALSFSSATYTINGGSALTTVPFASFVLSPIGDQDILNNGFQLTYEQQTNRKSLLDYWDNIIRILNQNQFIEAVMKLTDIDIYNLDLTKLVYIPDFESYFYVNAIPEYTGEPTKVELIKF